MSDSATDFPASRAAALQRLTAFDPGPYARRRNHLDGPVSRLSPYLTHGVLSLPEVIEGLEARHTLSPEDKFLFELAWREYFQHVWRHLGDGIRRAARPAPARRYGQTLPEDVLSAATGLPAIDRAIATLYRTGYLHNHQRLWLASYLVHLRKVDWCVGADWMYGYLLDGDLASNTLSWQWVAGTWTGKPYLFNADNVARYTPSDWPHAHAEGSAVDRSYSELEHLARSDMDVGPEAEDEPRPHRMLPPPVQSHPPIEALEVKHPEAAILLREAQWLMHPWCLHLPASQPEKTVGMLVTDFHQRYPWSEARWRWVLQAMQPSCRAILVGSRDDWQASLSAAPRRLSSIATLHPEYREALAERVHTIPRATFFPDPERLQRSFSAFWRTISQGATAS